MEPDCGPEINKLLEGYRVSIELPVLWRDIDMLQHVNGVVYYKWFEQARIAYGERLGSIENYKRTGRAAILKEAHIAYKQSMTYPDTAVIGVRIASVERDRYHMETIIISKNRKVICADGGGTNVFYDYNLLEKADIPAELIDKAEEIEGRKFR